MARILIVDDYAPILTMLEITLKAAGHEVFLAGDGESALQKAIELVPDLLLTDIDLPGMSGLAVCEALKRRRATAGIAVILMTGSTHLHSPQDAWRAGASALLPKPFPRGRLLEEVSSAAMAAVAR